MTKRIFSTATALILFFSMCASALAADTYKIDPVHSSVAFSVQHMMISRVNGNFTDFNGMIMYDDKDPAKCSVEVHIKAGSLDTRNSNRDNDVKGPNYLDVEKFPEITFKSTRVEKTGAGYVAHGQLTIHGVSKDVDLPFTVSGPAKDPWGNMRIGAQAGLTINRKDYGVSFNKNLDGGGVLIGDDVKIDLSVEAVKQP